MQFPNSKHPPRKNIHFLLPIPQVQYSWVFHRLIFLFILLLWQPNRNLPFLLSDFSRERSYQVLDLCEWHCACEYREVRSKVVEYSIWLLLLIIFFFFLEAHSRSLIGHKVHCFHIVQEEYRCVSNLQTLSQI